jgi:hypothetical protein
VARFATKNFSEPRHGEVRRIFIPRTPVNKEAGHSWLSSSKKEEAYSPYSYGYDEYTNNETSTASLICSCRVLCGAGDGHVIEDHYNYKHSYKRCSPIPHLSHASPLCWIPIQRYPH